MKTPILLLANLLWAAAALSGADAGANNPMDAQAAFARLKTLAGEWEADTAMGKARLSYELIAGGTAVVERESGDKIPAMLTVYHLDGGRLLLTHYCMAGNQPRMQARSFNPATGELQFRCLDGTNLTAGAGHMRNATFRMMDHDHLLTEWEFYENGQQKFAETARYTRVR